MITIATICARGGSRGVPGKNIRPLLGKPLIAHTIEQALTVNAIDRVFVSTDSQEIADIAKQSGAEVPFLRPTVLATSEAGKLPVIRHLVDHVVHQGVEVGKIVDLDPTSPLRALSDIEACLDLLTEDADVVLTAYEAEKSPYFNMIEPLPRGGFDLSKRPDPPVVRRQDSPIVYSMNASIYVWWCATLDKGLYGSGTRLHVMPRERSIDIDSPIDFEFVEMLMQKKNTQVD
jgi:CMP-N,N'-diacetyllegionaminic acid synthase